MVNWASWAVAGVHEVGFAEGWEDAVPSLPSYRVLRPGGAVCRLLRPASGRVVVQMRLFFHVAHPPVPVIEGSVGRHRWTWNPDPGWSTLQHLLPPGRGVASIHLDIVAEGDPWFEARVIEVRVLAPSDPRVHPGVPSP